MLATLGLVVSLVLATAPATAQELVIPDISEAREIDAEAVSRTIESVQALENIDEQLRSSVIEQLQNAAMQVQNREAAEAAATSFSESLTAAPSRTEELRAELDQETPPPSLEDLGVDASDDLDDLTQRLSQELADQVAAETRVTDLETRVEVEAGRPAAARTRIGELRASRDELAEALQSAPPPGEAQILTNARRLGTALRRTAQAAEINKLEQELLSHSARLSLLRAQLDAAERARMQAAARVELIRELVNTRRQEAADLAQQSAAAVELDAADKHPVIRMLAEQNTTLTRQLPTIAAKIETASQRLEQLQSEAADVEQRLERGQQRIDVAGLNRTIGVLMMEESRNLPQVSQYRSQVRNRRNEIAEIGLAEVRVREQRRELRSVDARTDQLMAEIATDIADETELAETRSAVRSLLRDQRELLLQAENSYNSYLQVLEDLDAAQRRLLETASEYQDFLNENMLWIPSAPVALTGDWQGSDIAGSAALSVTPWLTTIADLGESVAANPFIAVVALLLLAGLYALRRRLSAYALSLNSRIGHASTDHISLTVVALLAAAVRALPMSLTLAAIGWFLLNGPDPSAFSATVSNALFIVAPFLYNLMLFRVLAAKNGVLCAHFGWRPQNLAIIRKQLDRLVALGAPLVFGVVVFYSSELAFDRATMGRFFFVGLLAVLVLSFHPLAHPKSGIAASYYRSHRDSWLTKLRWFWYLLATGLPLLLGVLSLLGYLYTSVTLTGLIVDTIWLALTLIVVNLIVLRWIALTRARLALKVEQEERELQAEPPPEDNAPEVESQQVDVDKVDSQTRQLLRWGLIVVAAVVGWGIWSDVFPAFRLFDQVALWSQTIVVDGVETIAPVTLTDLLLALLVAAGTAVAYRNLPGLMEIAVLQRLTLQPGSRYAINTLVRYVVITVGAISVLGIVGWNWSQIQWLVAALSVGLGFGLQEVVANFVSGLIILFERPVRVGDTVTVGQLSGTVSKVRIRATTITDWDRKEIIVPNKSFITEQVVNWTLADPITRVVVEVGISYSSDVERAHTVMQETLRSLPLVLDEPGPQVFFLGFGDSSLNFRLHAFSRQLSDRLPLTHAIHEAILKALRENDIEIPFPQRDLHIRSTVEKD
jgi:potassium efflux system protein